MLKLMVGCWLEITKLVDIKGKITKGFQIFVKESNGFCFANE